MESKRIIICGNGSSVRQDMWNTPVQSLPLWNKIKDETHITLNYSYNYTNPTFCCFYDASFYITNRFDLQRFPLVIGPNKTELRNVLMSNTCLVPIKTKYVNDFWVNGFYSSNLVGVLALSLAIGLGYNEIYLLGFDFGSIDGHTHYYEDEVDLKAKDCNGNRKYRGIGFKDRPFGKDHRTNNYNNDSSKDFEPFLNYLNDYKIFNVSPRSNLKEFQKISYKDFYEVIEVDTQKVDHGIERDRIEAEILLHR